MALRQIQTRLLHCMLPIALAFGAAAGEIPLQAWVHDPAIDSPRLSPDGARLAAISPAGIGQPPDIAVWSTADLGKPPERFRPKQVKLHSLTWLSNDQLLVSGRQKVDVRIGTLRGRTFQDFAYIVDMEDKKFRRLLRTRDDIWKFRLAGLLRNDPDHFLLAVTTQRESKELLRVNLKSLTALRVLRGAADETIAADLHGNAWLKSKLDGKGADTRRVYSYKHPDTGEW
ncbi:MAG: hypothetical protein ACR2PJ_02195, partial [Pseudomonadales bacterium]